MVLIGARGSLDGFRTLFFPEDVIMTRWAFSLFCGVVVSDCGDRAGRPFDGRARAGWRCIAFDAAGGRDRLCVEKTRMN